MNWAQTNYIAAVVFAATLLHVLTQHGDRRVAVCGIVALTLAFVSAYIGSLAHELQDNKVYIVLGTITLVVACIAGLAGVLFY